MQAQPEVSPGLEELIGQAIVDRELRAGLLNGQKAQLLGRFDLTPEERQVLMSIQANSLGALAQQLQSWLQSEQPESRRHIRYA